MNKQLQLAPVAIFVYNRPEHTKKMLEALSANEGASSTELYIFSDGPHPNSTLDQLEKIETVRSIIKDITWAKNVAIQEERFNKGLASSILSGVTTLLNRYDKVIVLEDDLLTSVGFLKYMNDALFTYENKEAVMHICGYMYPVNTGSENILFLRILSCWGWATWKRAWNYLDLNSHNLLTQINSKRLIKQFNINGHADFYTQLQNNSNGRINTWAVRWYASWWLKNGYAMHPHQTLVANIGHDGTGVHCFPTSAYESKLISYVTVPLLDVIENKPATLRIDEFYRKLLKVPFSRLVKQRILYYSKNLWKRIRNA